MVELSKTGLVAQVDLTDRNSGSKIGVGHVERTSGGHVIIHINGEDVPSCIEGSFSIGEIKVQEGEQ
ncbi:hypothetical protein SEA_CLUBPENGUIN_70 [Streptomyces phage ClubPenguin]|nr:hypothetical protein SEA_CLUBPENGUIN_70 [Streptomyces phage ClubPenguin]